MRFREWPRGFQVLATVGVLSLAAGGAIAAAAAAPGTKDRTGKISTGDLLVFVAKPPSLNPAGTNLLIFNVPAGPWLLFGNVVAVKSNGDPISLECVLRASGRPDIEAAVGLPARGLRNLTLEAGVKLKQTTTYRVRCNLFPSDPATVSVTSVWVHALRVRSISVKKPLF